MRTYSRKPVKHKRLNGLLDLCRLCLQKATDLKPIFNDNIDNGTFLPSRIMICLGLEMTRDEHLPNMICSQCYQDLDNYYNFKEKCLSSNEKLQTYVIITRDIENKKEDLDLKLINNNCTSLNEKLQKYVLINREIENRKEDLDLNLINNNGTLSIEKIQTNVLINRDIENRTEELVLKLNNNNCTLPELDGECGSNELDDDDIVLALTDEDALEVINIFRETTGCSNDEQDEEEERVQTVSTSYNINDSLDFLNSTSESIPPIPEDIPNYLSTILVQFGVFIKNDEQVKVIDKTFKHIQLDNDEGSITLEIVEIEDPPPKKDIKEFLDREIDNNSDIKFLYNAGSGILKGSISCSTCGKQFTRRAALVRHERVHSGARPFVCRHCQRPFSQKEVLRRHEHTHKAQRPHACTSCDKSFAQPASLRFHRQSQHATHPRPLLLHPCKICSKVYLHASGLCRHMWIHEGRLFSCDVCNKTFKDKSSLLRHIKTVGSHEHHRAQEHSAQDKTETKQVSKK